MGKRSKTGWIKWVILAVVLVVLAYFAWPTISAMLSGSNSANNGARQTNANANFGAMGNAPSGEVQNSTRNTTAVKRDNLSVSVSGSGKVSPADTRTVYSKTSGRVDELSISVGDAVKTGDVMMRLASDDLSTNIATLQRTLFDTQITLADVRDSGSTYNIYAPAAGRVKLMKAEEDDDVAMLMKQYGYLCVISRDGKMKVEFEPQGSEALNVGDKVNVLVKNTTVQGTVDQLTGLSGKVSVTIDDDTYDVGEHVSVTTLLGDRLGEGALDVNMPIPVTGIGGTVENIYYEDNDKVSSGYRLFYLTGRTPSSELQQALLAYTEAKVALDNALDQQEGLVVRAPMDGVITSVDTSLGAKLEEGAQAFSIQSNNNFKVIATVDELDIVGVKPGQNVTVELDAYPNKVFNATVTSISGVGTVEGGVATYEVTVLLSGNDGFMDGMTANIEVLTTDRKDALMLPVEAISTSNGRTYVTLVAGGQTQVETGASDGTNIEILSGLNEGDQVLLTRTGNSGSTGTYNGAQTNRTFVGGMGGMGGGGNMPRN